MDSLAVVRARQRLLVAEHIDATSALVLTDAGTYVRIPAGAVAFLRDLLTREWGLTIRECQANHPAVRLERLIELGLVDVIPAGGLPVDCRLAAEFVCWNLWAQGRMRARGWRAVSVRMGEPAGAFDSIARPLLFDRMEDAANAGFAVAGTSRLCTVVALALTDMLRRRGFPAQIEVTSDPRQIDPHAYAVVGRHRVDPSDDQNLAPAFRPIGP